MRGGFLRNEAARLKVGVSYEQFRKNGVLLMEITVRGFKLLVDEWMPCLRIEMQNAAESGDRLRSMYAFNLLNPDLGVAVEGDVAFIEPPCWKHATWLAVSYLPNIAHILGKVIMRLIGKHRADIEPIEIRTNCTVKVFAMKSRAPHVCILGFCAEEVIQCRSLVQQRLSILGREVAAERRSTNRGIGFEDEQLYIGLL
jgi:hypothetical protein